MHQKTTEILGDVHFHRLLLAFDRDLAAMTREDGCPKCRATLHTADFARKPRGVPSGLSQSEEYRKRLSLCCSKDGCRKRTTPPSLRFLGRKVYLAAVVVLISTLRCGPTPARVHQLQELVGVSRRTLSRWRQWWREVFVASPFWRAHAGAFMPPVSTAGLPASLLQRFSGELPEQLLSLLRWLAPVSRPRAMHAS